MLWQGPMEIIEKLGMNSYKLKYLYNNQLVNKVLQNTFIGFLFENCYDSITKSIIYYI